MSGLPDNQPFDPELDADLDEIYGRPPSKNGDGDGDR